MGEPNVTMLRKISVQFEISGSADTKISVEKEMNDADPLLLWKILQDENNPFSFMKNTEQRKGCTVRGASLRRPFVKTLKFAFHFLLVLGILYLSAIVFAYLEHPSLHSDNRVSCKIKKDKKTQNFSEFHAILHANGSTTFSQCNITCLSSCVDALQQQEKDVFSDEGSFGHLQVQKWFYFVIIATTTIGYGDVSPQTEKGKFFYCWFSVIGIVLMISLLKSCGKVLSRINNGFHQLVRKNFWKGSSFFSDELLSVISMTSLVVVYLSIGILHDRNEWREKHSLLDITYYWIVSLTTVGFGDISHSLEFEFEHAYELTLYRVFGLSLVAGIIESIQLYLKMRRKELQLKNLNEKLLLLQKKIADKAQGAIDIPRFDEVKAQEYRLFNALKQVSTFMFDEEDPDLLSEEN